MSAAGKTGTLAEQETERNRSDAGSARTTENEGGGGSFQFRYAARGEESKTRWGKVRDLEAGREVPVTEFRKV